MTMIKIEDLTTEKVAELSDKELKQLRDRANQVYNKTAKSDEVMDLAQLVDKYDLVVKEMDKRNILIKWSSPLDKIRFKKAMFGVNFTKLPDKVLDGAFISIVGDYAENPKKNEKPVKIHIKTSNKEAAKKIEDDLKTKLTEAISNELEFAYDAKLPQSVYVPIYSLKLSPNTDLTRQEASTATEQAKSKDDVIKDFFNVPRLSKDEKKESIQFTKQDKKKHLVGGIVYAPNTLDTDEEWTSKDEIEKAAYMWMVNYQRHFVQHNDKEGRAPIYVVENFIATEDTKKDGEVIPEGAWFLMSWVDVDTEGGKDIWKAIEEGELTGWSLGGRASIVELSPEEE